MSRHSQKTRRLALMGLLFALAMALSYLESLLPGVGLPGVKLGLSNVVTMYCLFTAGPWAALALAALKAGFVLLTRGGTAALLSFSGGLCAVMAMALCHKLVASKGMTSVAGAVTHNLAQLATATALLSLPLAFYLLPVLVVGGIIMGIITAYILKVVSPLLARWEGKSVTQGRFVKK